MTAGRARRLIARQSGFILILLVLAAWEAAALALQVRYLPTPVKVLESLVAILTGPSLVEHVLPSVARALAGLGIGVALGTILGLVLGYYRGLDPWVRPLIEFGRVLPAPAILPAALIVLGPTSQMRVSIIAFGCFFPVLLNAIDGARRVDELMIDTARAFGLTSRQILRRVLLPAAVPQILAGVRIALGIALIMMVISELIATSAGIGVLLFQSQRLFRIADTYAVVLLLGFIGWGVTASYLRFERASTKWQQGGGRREHE